MNEINITEAGMRRAVRAIRQAGHDHNLNNEEIVEIVAASLSEPTGAAIIAGAALQKWNMADERSPKFALHAASCNYTDIAAVVLDAFELSSFGPSYDEVAEPWPGVVPAPPPWAQPAPAPQWPPPPPWVTPAPHTPFPPPIPAPAMVDSEALAMYRQVIEALTEAQRALHSLADREGHSVRRMDAVRAHKQARVCGDALRALAALSGREAPQANTTDAEQEASAAKLADTGQSADGQAF